MVGFQQEEDKLLCRFIGRMDTTVSMSIEKDVLENIRRSSTPVVFDLQEVDYVASAFLRLCIAGAKAAGERKMTMINVKPAIKKVFKVAGLDEEYSIQ